MDFDLKGVIEQIVAKLTKDSDLFKSFKKDPERTVERVAGVDIPDGMMDKIIEGVMTALKIKPDNKFVAFFKKLFGKN